MFDFLKKKNEASPASAAPSPDDPTAKWRSQIDELEHQHGALKSLLNKLAPANSSSSSSPTRKLQDHAVTAGGEEDGATADVAVASEAHQHRQPAEGGEENKNIETLTALQVLCRDSIAPQLERSVVRLRQQSENIAKAFALCRELKAESTSLQRKNEGLTIESETARLTIIELMEKIKKIGGSGAVNAAKQQQADLRTQLEQKQIEQKREAELKKLRKENEDLREASRSALGSPMNSSPYLQQQQQQEEHSPPAHLPSPSPPPAATTPQRTDIDLDSSSSNSKLEAEVSLLRQKIQELQHALEEQQLRHNDKLRDKDEALKRERELADQNAQSLQKHVDDLREEMVALKADVQRERELHDRQRCIVGLQSLQDEETSSRCFSIMADEGESLSGIQAPFVKGVLEMLSEVQKARDRLQHDLTENTRALMKLQASPSPSPEKSKSRFF